MLALPPIDTNAIHAGHVHAVEHAAHVRHDKHVAHELAVHLRHVEAIHLEHEQQLLTIHLRWEAAHAPAAEQLAPLAPQPAMGTPVSLPAGSGSYEACVIAHESGGDYQAVNAESGAGGAFQFLPSTWAGLGLPGLPQDASVAMQNAAFNTLHAQAGDAPWITDGCG